MNPLDPNLLPTLLEDAGPAGLILGLIILVVLFITGRVRRGKDADEWREVAEANADTLANLLPVVEHIVATQEQQGAILEDLKRTHVIEAEVRRRLGEPQDEMAS